MSKSEENPSAGLTLKVSLSKSVSHRANFSCPVLHKNNIKAISEDGSKTKQAVSIKFRTANDANNFVDSSILSANIFFFLIYILI